MRIIFSLIFLIWSFTGFSQSLEDRIDSFYNQHIIAGEVAYAKISQSSVTLDELLQEIKATDWNALAPAGQTAFLINAYNLYVLKAVVDRYPVISPKAINGFFTQKKYKLQQKNYSLDQIEKDLLFGIERDPRFHLVLICAAKSCPPFYPKAFRGGQLEQQLAAASKQAINSDWVKTEGDQYLVSELFSWYAFDFGNVADFINKYKEDTPIKIGNSVSVQRVKFTKYDWTLNESLPQGKVQQPFLTASQLMPVGTWELKAFQANYTQVERNGFDNDNTRSTYFSSFNQLLVGISPGWNIGLDIVWKRNNINDLAGDSWLNVFSEPLGRSPRSIPCAETGNFSPNSPCNQGATSDVLRNAAGDTLFHQVSQGLAHLGPKVKFRLFKKIPRLTTQQTFYIPIQKAVDGQWISYTQFFYDVRLGAKGSLFTELSFWTPVHPNFKINTFAKTFWSYFPNRKFSVYGMLAFPGEYGAGLKINLLRRLELELLTTRFIAIEKFFGDRRASTFNIGLRIHP